jgi:hypothetical protein
MQDLAAIDLKSSSSHSDASDSVSRAANSSALMDPAEHPAKKINERIIAASFEIFEFIFISSLV